MEERLFKDNSRILLEDAAKTIQDAERFLEEPGRHVYNEELKIVLNRYGNYEAVPVQRRARRKNNT